MFTNGGGVKVFGLRSWIYVHCTIKYTYISTGTCMWTADNGQRTTP